jgi:hypothetical protein
LTATVLVAFYTALHSIAVRAESYIQQQQMGMASPDQDLFQLWCIVARSDGGTGIQLGHAVGRGADFVVGWVCSLLVFGPLVHT